MILLVQLPSSALKVITHILTVMKMATAKTEGHACFPKLDYMLPRGHGLRAVRSQPSGRRTGDTGPPRHPPTALPPLRFLKGDSPAGKVEDPSQKTRGHPAAQCDM